MTKLVVFLTFIPWLAYFILSTIKNIKKTRNEKMTIKYINENIFNIFRFDTIILISILIYFSLSYPKSDQIWLARVLLFATINLYLFVNRLYDKVEKKDQLNKKERNIAFLSILISLIPVIFYICTKKYQITYYIMFGLGFFNYFITIICKYILEKIKKKK